MKVIVRYLLILCTAVATLGCSSEPGDEAGKAACYETEFGTLPPAGVTDIQAKQYVVQDTIVAWLRFEATPDVVDSLLKRFALSDRKTFDEASGGANTPGWWKPDGDHVTVFYSVEGWSKGFTSSTAVIAHDAGKRVVYFSHTAFH